MFKHQNIPDVYVILLENEISVFNGYINKYNTYTIV